MKGVNGTEWVRVSVMETCVREARKQERIKASAGFLPLVVAGAVAGATFVAVAKALAGLL